MVQGIFLDRDGTINVQRRDFVRSSRDLVLLPGALAAIVRLATLNVPIIVVTNQSCVGRGQLAQAELDAIHADLAATIRRSGGRIDGFYVCTHHPDASCSCRKPRPGLLQQAMADFHLRAADCVMVGDSVSDCGAASAAGCRCVLVCTGLQGDLLAEAGSSFQRASEQIGTDLQVAPSLWHASRLILEQAYRSDRGRYAA